MAERAEVEPRTAVDPATHVIHGFVTDGVARALIGGVIRDYEKLLAKRVRRPVADTSGFIDARTAQPYLDACRVIIEEDLRQRASVYSSPRWLWYLRRLPSSLFEGELGTTYGYDLGLSEIVSATGRYRGAIAGIRAKDVAYNLEEKHLVRVVELAGGAIFLSQIHILLRYSGKGVRFTAPRVALLEPAPTPEEEAAIVLYDKRTEAGHLPFLRTGSIVGSEGRGRLTVGLAFAEPYRKIKVPMSEEDNEFEANVLSNTALVRFNLDQLLELMADRRVSIDTWLSREMKALIAFLTLYSQLQDELPHVRLPIVRNGYCFVWEEHMLQFLAKFLPDVKDTFEKASIPWDLPAEPKEFLGILEAMGGRTWPLLHGPILRREGKLLMIDQLAATYRLEGTLESPRVEGDAANARGDHFEDVIQALIDQSPWRPEGKLRDLIGRHIENADGPITNIDALGAKGNEILLVSCKSFPYNGAYDAGDYRTIRNVESMVNAAVQSWDQKLTTIKTAPYGRNYDFSAFTSFIGVVVTPHGAFTHLGPTTAFCARGLRAASSASELRRWLIGEENV